MSNSHPFLSLRGVSENNLKDLSLDIPHDQLIVVTGVSGSGKSTLAFDTIYAEGGRRYIETFSPYTRQFLSRLHRPQLEKIDGVRSALALEQRNSAVNSRSTVGTVTEINDYLKLLWAKRSTMYCPDCAKEVTKSSAQSVAHSILARELGEARVLICAPVEVTGKAKVNSLRESLQSAGFVRFYSPQKHEAVRLEELAQSDISKSKSLLVVLDRLALKKADAEITKKLVSSVAQAFEVGRGAAVVLLYGQDEQAPEQLNFREGYSCDSCQTSYRAPTPSLFTFNSPLGACETCQGFGKILEIDPDICVPNKGLSIIEGAVQCWNTDSTEWERNRLLSFCKKAGIDTKKPWRKLSAKEQGLIFNGSEKPEYEGILGWFAWLEKKKYKMHVRVFLSRYRSERECPDCHGTRLRPFASCFEIRGKKLHDLWQMPVTELVNFFEELVKEHPQWLSEDSVLSELLNRVKYLEQIGLSYLTLDRQTRTLSGGEFQRVNLTAILGSQLVNTTLVLDEPTIGLHSRDTSRLMNSITALRNRGNTVVVVEHDRDVIMQADQVIDIGPQAGRDGGAIVYQGGVKGLLKEKGSLTGRYLAGKVDSSRERAAVKSKQQLVITGCRANNLKNISVSIPLGQLVIVSGVSGSGKSSFVEDCLFKAYQAVQSGANPKKLASEKGLQVESLLGLEQLDEVVLIDQSPVGKTPRSNPATYTKAWELIRDCLAETVDAQRLALNASAFSFNVDGGRCGECKGAGKLRVEMQFLADVYVDCEVCSGKRFQEKVLEVRYEGKSVTDFLAMPISEAIFFFQKVAEQKRADEICLRLQPLVDLGLGYLTLGHPLSHLSGGEAQRLKLASYLGEISKGKKALIILDEPTTGLHFHNVAELLDTFDKLIARGHSILCIEHNLDVVKGADWIIELGPDGGDAGGELVAEGSYDTFLTDPKLRKLSQTAKFLNSSDAQPKSELVLVAEKQDSIRIVGARHHNLKNVSAEVEKDKITVITGVSGSGKSSLAFDILFAEGQRRYIDCLSPYARQFIKQLERADVDKVESIPPTVALSQKTAPPLGVSTIATTTEIYQYLRLLYSKVGAQHCPKHNVEITAADAESLAVRIEEQFSGERIFLFAPVVSGRKGYHNDLFRRAFAAEIYEARVDDSLVKISEDLRLERHKLHFVSLLVASITVSKKTRPMLVEAIEQCLLLGGGTVEVAPREKSAKFKVFSSERLCPKCGEGFHQLDPQDFSFRSNRGVCKKCNGRGAVGDEEKGTEKVCPVCHGARISEIGRFVFIGGKSISDLTKMTAPQLLAFFKSHKFDQRLTPVVKPILDELLSRLNVVNEVGLDYLELDRDSSSISGGEAQRLRLARTLGSPLTGVCYVLDEPTIGLHRSEHEKLMKLLVRLRDEGNTLVVVEHDQDTICAADRVIDVGPGGGSAGGKIVCAGTVAQLKRSKISQTAAELRKREGLKVTTSQASRADSAADWLELRGAKKNNLKDITVRLPLGALTVVAGVSGSGKSSLVHGCLVPAVLEGFDPKNKTKRRAHFNLLKGGDKIERFVEVDQSPIGKTSTSTPASFLGVMSEIRNIFSSMPEAQIRGWKPSHFSFNSGKGKCAVCEGRGFIKVPMSFLPDATTLCEGCSGLRFDDETLSIKFQGRSIGEVLKLTICEALELFANHPKVSRTLSYAEQLGIGYIQLGQPTHTLSGGEAQRLKIAEELGSKRASNTLYVLDEPTTGLHMADVSRLIAVLQKLVEAGNTVVVIEHDLDLVSAADYLIELGPGSGDKGGELLFSGPPREIISAKVKTPTSRYLVTT